MDGIGASFPVAAGQAALATLQQIPAQLQAQAKAAAETRLQTLLETYRKLAPLADAQTLTGLAKQIGGAAVALGDSAWQPVSARDDAEAKATLTAAGDVVEAIRRRLARHRDTAGLAVVRRAARDIATASAGIAGPSSAGGLNIQV